jgi:hypothetical protein
VSNRQARHQARSSHLGLAVDSAPTDTPMTSTRHQLSSATVSLVNTTWTIVLAVLGLVAATASAIAAIGSWSAARRSDKAATILAIIERDRRHTELTPTFDITCYCSSVGDTAYMQLTLTGPPGLDGLDGVALSIRDDRTNRTPAIAGGPAAEELSAVIWGPLRFRSHVNSDDELGRSIPAFPLVRQETTRFALDSSLVPQWVADRDYWHRQYANHPLRLTLTCAREGHASWTIPIDVPIESEPNDQQPATAGK